MLEFFIVILILLIILSATFSGIETALISVSLIRTRALAAQKKKGSEALLRLKENPQRLLVTILLANNLVNIAAASIATAVFTDMFGSSGIGIATGIMTFLILVFGEITPKSYAIQNAEKLSLRASRSIEIMIKVLSPLVWILEGFTSVTMKRFGGKKERKLTEEEISTIVTVGREEGLLRKEVAEMMQSLLEFEEITIEEVMTPKSEIAFVNADSELKDVLDYVVRTPYSRYPAYYKTMDNIVGILNVDDVLKYIKRRKLDVKIKSIGRDVYFVPETKKIHDLLVEFRKRKTKMSIVVDEYGDVKGLATIDDVLEEIVGDIFDKSMRREVYLKPIDDKTIRADAKTKVEQIERELHIGLKEQHFSTIGGFIEHKLGRIPKRGERVEMEKATIIVEKASEQKIERVKIAKK